MSKKSEPHSINRARFARRFLGLSEDWSASLVGLFLLAVSLLFCFWTNPPGVDWTDAHARAMQLREEERRLEIDQEGNLSSGERARLARERRKATIEKIGITWEPPVKTWLFKVGSWNTNPLDALRGSAAAKDSPGPTLWIPMICTALLLAFIGGLAVVLRGQPVVAFLKAFPMLFLLSLLAYLLAGQDVIKYYNFEYPLWGLFVGMLICNTVGTPIWLRAAVQGELFIKIGLVLLGAEVLLSRLFALGLPGIFVAWIVTPVVLVTTFVLGQRLLKIPSRSLNMVISADMSVCGVSAAIATAAACRAKKEELSLAIGLSLTFTAVMMVVLPLVVRWIGLDPVVGGAWIGGTIDSTGAVVAAGETLGIVGSETAITVKMIQNILIGFTALGVAIYWTRWVEPAEKSPNSSWEKTAGQDTLRQNTSGRNTSGQNTSGQNAAGQDVSGQSSDSVAISGVDPHKIGLAEIWRRFPKFVIGFILASIVCSTLFGISFFGETWVQVTTQKITGQLRGWLFCMAFVAIGLSTNFRELAPYLSSGKPLVLYVCGQSFNLLLTLAMAYLMFGVLFAG